MKVKNSLEFVLDMQYSKLVYREAELATLNPGDLVNVSLGGGESFELMNYLGKSGELETNPKISSFLNPAQGMPLNIWVSRALYLHFDGRVMFNRLYRTHRVIEPNSSEYHAALALVE